MNAVALYAWRGGVKMSASNGAENMSPPKARKRIKLSALKVAHHTPEE